MKPAYPGADKHAKSDRHRLGERTFAQRSLSMHARFGSQTASFFSPSIRADYGRSCSLDRVENIGPWRRRSINLLRDCSSRIFEDVPSDVSARIGDIGDRELDDQEEDVISNAADEVFGITPHRRSAGSSSRSWQKGSIRFSSELEMGTLGHVENGFSAQARDRVDLVGTVNVIGGRGSMSLKQENVLGAKIGTARIANGTLLRRNSFQLGDIKYSGYSSSVLPLTTEETSLPTNDVLNAREKSDNILVVQSVHSLPFQLYKLPRALDYMAYLIHMAVFGIFGVFGRHLLQKLFGPGCLALTSDKSPFYLDLPANVVGSFLMGWFGLVFKGDVRHVSDHLAIGLTTGFMGSLTTFSGWNQKMVELSSRDHWVFAVAGIVFGLFIVNEGLRLGVASAEWLRGRLLSAFSHSPGIPNVIPDRWQVQTRTQHAVVNAMLLLILGMLWCISGLFARRQLDRDTDGAVLWLACLVGPPGVWLRWFLARFNGQGLGRKGYLKWLPVGTLAANILAAIIMEALATISKVANTTRSGIIIKGIQFGFLGCLSTVSTFAIEMYAMRQSGHVSRELAYAVATLLPSFAMGILIYCVPVWTRHYH